MREALRVAERVARSDASVFVRGETGTGKDVLAEAIHLASSRGEAPFVKIDCPALPADLFESELFGFERGAFTDARAARVGRFEIAQRGTIYLDEIADLAPELQAKLLRVVQERRFSRLGSSRTIELDTRFITSSNRDVESMVDSEQFRSDLFFRLNVVTITLPPLRERPEDFAMLVRQYLGDASRQQRKKLRGVDPAATELLERYHWPGNLRELRHVIERAVILAPGEMLTPDDLPTETLVRPPALVEAAAEADWSLARLEEAYIREIMRKTRGNNSRAARILGINRKTLLEKRKKYGIP